MKEMKDQIKTLNGTTSMQQVEIIANSNFNILDIDNIYRVKTKDIMFINMTRHIDKKTIITIAKQVHLKCNYFDSQIEMKICINDSLTPANCEKISYTNG